MNKPKTKITTRRWRREDIPEIIACSRATCHDYSEEYIYTERQYEMQLAAFPQGQFVAVCGEEIIGYATSMIVNIDDEFWYDVDEFTGAGTFRHTPDATPFTADIAVHPDYQRRASPCCSISARRAFKKYNLNMILWKNSRI